MSGNFTSFICSFNSSFTSSKASTESLSNSSIKDNLGNAINGSMGGFSLADFIKFGFAIKLESGSNESYPNNCSLINAASSIEFEKTPT